jgi:hypothetical protein
MSMLIDGYFVGKCESLEDLKDVVCAAVEGGSCRISIDDRAVNRWRFETGEAREMRRVELAIERLRDFGAIVVVDRSVGVGERTVAVHRDDFVRVVRDVVRGLALEGYGVVRVRVA